MKDGVKAILGKTITGIIVKEGSLSVRSQVFLLFDDETYYEFYTSMPEILGTSGLCIGNAKDVHKYLPDTTKVIFEAHLPKTIQKGPNNEGESIVQ